MKKMTGVKNVGVFIGEEVWLENSPRAQAIFEPNLFSYKYPNILNLSFFIPTRL
jgi:hypothetical protein